MRPSGRGRLARGAATLHDDGVALGEGGSVGSPAPSPYVGAGVIAAGLVVLVVGVVLLNRTDEPPRLAMPTSDGVTLPTDSDGRTVDVPPSQPAGVGVASAPTARCCGPTPSGPASSTARPASRSSSRCRRTRRSTPSPARSIPRPPGTSGPDRTTGRRPPRPGRHAPARPGDDRRPAPTTDRRPPPTDDPDHDRGADDHHRGARPPPKSRRPPPRRRPTSDDLRRTRRSPDRGRRRASRSVRPSGGRRRCGASRASAR